MEYIIVPNKLEDLKLYKELNISTFIIGLENYSVNYIEASLDEIENLCKEYSLFIAINKNIFNNELNDIKKRLEKLSKLPILGVLFYDLGILNIVTDNKLNIPLVWHQTHMVTNYNTCNFYNNKGVEYAYLANEITLSEMIEIKNNTKMKLFVEVFGYPIMSHSRRKLLSNYFKSINKTPTKNTYKLCEKDNTYILKETSKGSSILYGKITNGARPLFDLIDNDFSYLVLDMQDIDINISIEVVKKYQYIKDNIESITPIEKEEIIKFMNDLVGDSTNFFYKKTIFKVKGDK